MFWSHVGVFFRTAYNKAQTDLDTKLNGVMTFLKLHGITGQLRDDILDYFEFRYLIRCFIQILFIGWLIYLIHQF